MIFKVLLRKAIYRFCSKPFFWIILKKFRNDFDIFCFHRVLPLEEFKKLTDKEKEFAVTTDFFQAFLEFLSTRYEFCNLNEGMQNHDHKKQKCHITFDDGYLDNLNHALPILEKFSAPATIYISDGIISRSITSTDHTCSVDINKFLTWDDVRELDKSNLVEIGGHTHSHAMLSMLSGGDLVSEIDLSKSNIEYELGHKIEHFAFPYGGKGTFNRDAIKVIKDSGYKSAATVICKKTNFSKNRFEVPRYLVTYKWTEQINLSRLSGISNFLNHQLLP